MTTRIRSGSRSIEISNPGKVLFPDAGITKADMARYYRDVGEVMLPHARGRPITVQRFPDGIRKKGFFQQKRSEHFPDWIDGLRIERSGKSGKIEHVVCNNRATLIYLADQAVVTFHGWLSRAGRIGNPDKLVFDLDPPGGADFATVIFAARRVRELMQALGMTPYVMTTGSKGLHVVAPLDAKAGFDAVRDLAHAMARHLAKRHPDELTVEQRKNKRRGRLYLDTLRNSRGQTSVLPYSLRAKPGAPAATPLEWDELSRRNIGPQRFTLRNMQRRLAQRNDPWADFHRHAKGIASAREALRAMENGKSDANG